MKISRETSKRDATTSTNRMLRRSGEWVVRVVEMCVHTHVMCVRIGFDLRTCNKYKWNAPLFGRSNLIVILLYCCCLTYIYWREKKKNYLKNVTIVSVKIYSKNVCARAYKNRSESHGFRVFLQFFFCPNNIYCRERERENWRVALEPYRKPLAIRLFVICVVCVDRLSKFRAGFGRERERER